MEPPVPPQRRPSSVAPSPQPDDRQILLQNQQQTISLLVSEKAELTAQLRRLDGLELSVFSTSQLLLLSFIV